MVKGGAVGAEGSGARFGVLDGAACAMTTLGASTALGAGPWDGVTPVTVCATPTRTFCSLDSGAIGFSMVGSAGTVFAVTFLGVLRWAASTVIVALCKDDGCSASGSAVENDWLGIGSDAPDGMLPKATKTPTPTTIK